MHVLSIEPESKPSNHHTGTWVNTQTIGLQDVGPWLCWERWWVLCHWPPRHLQLAARRASGTAGPPHSHWPRCGRNGREGAELSVVPRSRLTTGPRLGMLKAVPPLQPPQPAYHRCCRKWYAAAAKSLQSCPTPCDPIDGSPPGSGIPGILQARTLEWDAISFSNACMHMHAKSLQSCPTLCYLMDSSPPGSSVHGILQARILEWGAISS